MAEMAWDEHDDALADKLKGLDTVAPLAGEATVGSAKAVAAANSTEAKTAKFVQIFMEREHLTKRWNGSCQLAVMPGPPGHVHAGTPVAQGSTARFSAGFSYRNR